MKYPLINGKQMDVLRKKEFDHWREQMKWAIVHSEKNIASKDIEVIAWNCAFTIVTDTKK